MSIIFTNQIIKHRYIYKIRGIFRPMPMSLILILSALWSCGPREIETSPTSHRISLLPRHWFFPDKPAALQEDVKEIAGSFENGVRAIMGPRLIIGLKPGETLAEDRLRDLEALGFRPLLATLGEESRIKIFEGASAAQLLNQNILDTFAQENGVDFVHPDFKLTLRHHFPSPLSFSETKRDVASNLALEEQAVTEPLFHKAWHLDVIQAPTFWTHSKGGAEVTIAVIDLGFESTHPDLEPAWQSRGWNFAIDNQNLIYGAGPGHGTATSGIVGARENSLGTLGVCPQCSLLPLVIDDRVSTAILAFQYAKAQGASVVSNSWGYGIDLPVMQGLVAAIDEITTEGRGGKGASVVFAMGNLHRDDCGGRFPDLSSLEQVIAVSSVGRNMKKVNSSGFGPCLDLVAPSSATPLGGIVTTDRVGAKGFNSGQKEDLTDLNYTQRFYGTSAAAPQVSGAMGLIYSRWPEISRRDAEEKLMQQAQKVDRDTGAYDPRSGKSEEYGHGLLFLGF